MSGDSYVKDDRGRETNWVWSPSGIVDIHRPEKWGSVVLVDSPAGDSFSKRNEWMALKRKTLQKERIVQDQLMSLYYYAAHFRALTGRYPGSKVDLHPDIFSKVEGQCLMYSGTNDTFLARMVNNNDCSHSEERIDLSSMTSFSIDHRGNIKKTSGPSFRD